jgi:hypothetical protein
MGGHSSAAGGTRQVRLPACSGGQKFVSLQVMPITRSKIFAALAMLSLTSCSSVSVEKMRHAIPPQEGPKKSPDEILVRPFKVTNEALRVDRESKELEEFKTELCDRLARQTAERLKKHVAPARVVAECETLPRGNVWLVTGEFQRVNQGSRALRSIVGFGAGGTKMDTVVRIYDLSQGEPREFLNFETTGGSNFSQGVLGVLTFPVGGPMAFMSLANAVDGVRSGVTFDTKRTARETTAVLSEYLQKRRALVGKKPIKPKRLGQMPEMLPE